MNVHYNKHYKGYVKNLNSALKKLGEDDVDLEKIVKNISRYNTTVRNNAGGAFNHALFWKMLTPEKQNIHGEILKRIRKDFGSYENFKNKFVSTATRKFGSGWCWLVLTKRNTLKIICTSNQDNPLMNIIKNGGYPLLGLDLWEHAYYLKYKNKRDEYVQNFWKVVNWEFVNKLYNDQINREKKEEPKEQIKESRILTEQDSVDPCKGTRFKMVVYNRLSRNQKLNYSKLIFDVFRHKYSSNWKETDRSQGIESGFYDIEQPGRSVLSYANTNYTLMCFLVLMMNKIAKKKGWENLNLKSEDNATFDKNFNRFLGMLKAFKDEITQDWVMEKILDVLKKQHEKGQATENRFKKVCEEKKKTRKIEREREKEER
jgi:Fe-Mn family superoxide dismutase